MLICQIDSTWAIRWGADLGLGVDGFGSEREEGQVPRSLHF